MSAYRNILPGFGSPPDQDPPPGLDWDMLLGPAPFRRYNPHRGIYHFRWFWDTSGGQMTNLGQHSLDIVHWCLDPRGPLAVSSVGGRFCLNDHGETPDTQDAFFEYPGWTAAWSHRETSRGPAPTNPLEFFGTKGSLAISRKGFLASPDAQIDPETLVPQFTGSSHPAGGATRVRQIGPPRFRTDLVQDDSGDEYDQFRRHVRNFLDCIKSRQEPVSDLESAHRVATACHLANLSLRLGRKLRWDPDREAVIGDADAEARLERPYRAPWDAQLRALL
jgi:predicted dehydrogenase